ncbi:MAG TPA: hypothetical protein VF720_03605 [Candidatus Eisenbacteria bacterium]
MLTRTLGLLVALSILGCATERRPESLRATLADGEWRLLVDEQLAAPVTGIPGDAIPDSAYRDEPAGPELRVRAGQGATRIEIVDERLVGELTRESTPTSLTYDLVQGTVAGGRFRAWTERDVVRAELTLYGSGVPVLSSRRGKLIKVG